MLNWPDLIEIIKVTHFGLAVREIDRRLFAITEEESSLPSKQLNYDNVIHSITLPRHNIIYSDKYVYTILNIK